MGGEFLLEPPACLRERSRGILHAFAGLVDRSLLTVAFIDRLVVLAQQTQRVGHLALARSRSCHHVSRAGVSGNAPALDRFECGLLR